MLVMLHYPAGWAMARASEHVGGWIAVCCLLTWLGGIALAARSIPPGETVLLGNLPKYMWHAFYTLVFVTGGYFGLGKEISKTAILPWGVGVGLAGIFYVLLKFGYYRAGGFEWVSVAVVAGCLQGLVLFMVVGLLRLLPTMNAVLAMLKLERPLAWLGKSSLQVYLCHLWFARPLAHWEAAWPIKIGVFFVLAISTAVLIRWLIDYVVGYIVRLTHSRRTPQPDAL